MLVYPMKSMFWTNEKLSLMVAWSLSVSISRFKVQSSICHLVWFFDSGNSIVSGANFWCLSHNYLYKYLNTMHPYSYLLAVGFDTPGFERVLIKTV